MIKNAIIMVFFFYWSEVITIYFRDLNNDEYVAQITYRIDDDLNGNSVFEATIEPNKPNLLFLEELSEMWTLVDNQNVEYKIIYLKKKGEGESLTAEIKAVPLFYDVFDNDRVYEQYDRSLTAKAAFDIIFADSGYNHQLLGDYTAKQWQGFGGGDTRLGMFKDAINRYGVEFNKPVNTNVQLKERIGENLNVMYRHRLNASNIVQETDATGFWTYAKGFGDFGDGDVDGVDSDYRDAKLKREYTSPLAAIPGIGKRHAPPIKDGRIKSTTTMDTNLKTLVDESLKISVTADLHDLKKQGYPIAQAQVGDRVFLIDERIGLNEEVRVVSISTVRDWTDRIIDINITFGSEGITKRHQSEISSAVKSINDVLEGKRKIPMSALSNEVAIVTKALLSAQTELLFENGIIARDPNNPNLVVVLNSAGLGISTDGGLTFKNAITGRGILAEHIMAGTITAGGNHRIDIADGRIWSYSHDLLTMSFGQYQLDFFHPDGTQIGNFGPGNIVGTDIPGLRLVLARNQGYFNIGHDFEGVVQPTFRTFSFDESHYTFIAGPYADVTSAALYASTKLWSADAPRNQASLVAMTEGHELMARFGRNDSDSRLSFIHNGPDGAGRLIGYFNKDEFWAKSIKTDGTVQAGDRAVATMRGTSNSVRFEYSPGTYIEIVYNGRVNFFVEGVRKHTFSPD